MEISVGKCFPVLVNFSSEIIDEKSLHQSFKKFGPVKKVQAMKEKGKHRSALVYFLNNEVAEMAAREMDGNTIKGEKIQTKGPSNQQTKKENQKSQTHEKSSTTTTKDTTSASNHPKTPNVKNSQSAKFDWIDSDKEITDCYYFILNGVCKPKQGTKCMYRHLEKLRHSTDVCEKWSKRTCKNRKCPKLHPSQKHELELAEVKKKQLVRCPSHNAYKCLGECGKKNCNTHFQTEKGLQEHIVNSHSVCQECNAVFFNEEERLNHSHKNEKQVTKNENDPQAAEPIGVFWDIENCQVPKGKSALAIVQKIRKTFYPGCREVEFMCVCDTTKEKKEVLEELNRSQINIIHINATSKNAADDKVKQALRRFGQTHTPPATIVLISGDINFISELSDLRHRNNIKVILLHNQQASTVLKQTAHECHAFEHFTAGIQSSTTNTACNDGPKEILVSNLPQGNKQFKNKINTKLKLLVDNTGGKITHLQVTEDSNKEFDNIAIIRFADAETARRAVSRLQNEVIFGAKIRAKLKSKASKQNGESNQNKSQQLQQQNLIKSATPGQALNMSNTFAPMIPLMNPLPKPLLNGNGFLPLPYPIPPPPQLLQQAMLPVTTMGFPAMSNLAINKLAQQPALMMHQVSTGSNLKHQVKSKLAILDSPNLPTTSHKQYTAISNPSGHVEVLVQCSDKAMTSKDLKKEINTLINNHYKNTLITIPTQKSGSWHLFIKFPKLLDALWFIYSTKQENEKFKCSLYPDLLNANDPLMKLKIEVFELLFESNYQWVPLNEFLVRYKTSHKKALHVLDLDRVKDLIYVDGKPQLQFVCLLRNSAGQRKVKLTPNLKKSVVEILKTHNRKVPVASLPGLYWSYTKQTFADAQEGLTLTELVTSDEISLTGSSPQDQAMCFKREKPKKDQFHPLEDFRNDAIQLIKASPLFTVPINRVAPLYHQYFGRQLVLAEYGFKEMSEIFKAFPDIFKIEQNKTIIFTKAYTKFLLQELLHHLLFTRHRHQLPVSSLLTTFYRFHGYKLYYRNFGFDSFLDLVNSLDPEIFRIAGTGENKTLSLIRKSVKPDKDIIKTFANEVQQLVQNSPNKRVLIHSLSSDYFKHFGRQLKLNDLGFNKLNDLIAAISNYFEIKGDRDGRYITFPRKGHDFETMLVELQTILNKNPDLLMLGIQLPDVYKKTMKKDLPIEPANLNHLYEKLPSSISVIGQNSHRLLLYNNRADYPSLLFTEQMLELAYNCPHFEFTVQSMCEKMKEKGIEASLERVSREIKKCDKFKVKASTSGKDSYREKTYWIAPEESQKLFERDVLRLLYKEPDFKLPLNHVAKAFTKTYGKVLRVADFGVNKLAQILEKLPPGFVEVEYPPEGGQPTMILGKLGQVCMECDSVIEEHCGSLLLCNFDAEYLKKFGKHLLPKKLGFSKVKELLDCFSCVLKVYGENQTKFIVQKEKILNPPAKEVHSPRASIGSTLSSASNSCSDSGSDIEIESDHDSDGASTKPINNDLLLFPSEQDNPLSLNNNKSLSSEWWMMLDNNPNLPEPSLQPEQSFLADPDFDLDLISFTEFDDEDDVIRQGGIDDSTLPSPIIPPPHQLSYGELKQRDKSSSDNFVDHLFSGEATAQEPDLMRMLVGRCPSPADIFSPQQQAMAATTSSTISDTYSIFSPIKPSHQQSAAVGTDNVPYTQLLGDVFTDPHAPFSNANHRTIRPKIAANFNKPL
ncbi:meiosis regulator and mRNA stability factor 1-like [Clytia hemisphaerica]